MRLALLWAGRTRDGNLRAAIDVYVERIGRRYPVDIVEVKEEAAADRHSGAAARRLEGRRLREKLPRGFHVVLLDAGGAAMTSEEFAAYLGEKIDASSSALKGVAFVVGGHQGVDEETRETADQILSLSRMTLTHEMARLVLVEQIYRSLSILHGGKYHR